MEYIKIEINIKKSRINHYHYQIIYKPILKHNQIIKSKKIMTKIIIIRIYIKEMIHLIKNNKIKIKIIIIKNLKKTLCNNFIISRIIRKHKNKILDNMNYNDVFIYLIFYLFCL